jgi:hypothetical protein
VSCGGGGRRDSVTVVDDEELEEEAFLAAWAAADENALEVLLEALPHVATDAVPPLAELQAAVAHIRAGVTSQTWPYTYFTAAADWSPAPPHDDLQCFLDAMVSTMLPEAYPDDEWTDDELAAVAALEHADWIGSVVGLVRAGSGASATPEALLGYIDECPELEGERNPDDDIVIEHAFEVLLPLWQAIGVVDDNRRVTRLGVWALPQMLLLGWLPPRGDGRS